MGCRTRTVPSRPERVDAAAGAVGQRERAHHEKIGVSNPEPKTAARERFLALLERAHLNDPGDLTSEELEREVTLAHQEARE